MLTLRCKYIKKYVMNASAKTITQLEGVLAAVAQRCPSQEHDAVLSDLYFMVDDATAELVVFDDDDTELCRETIDGWKGVKADKFYAVVQRELQETIARQREVVDSINFLRPFSLVLVDKDHETVAELHIVDDDTVLLTGQLMENLEDDLDAFLKQLMEE